MNLVLIGPQSCGKTSVGKKLAQKLGKKFVDTDELLLANYCSTHDQISSPISIHEIYQKHGESYFRDLETQIISTLSSLEQTIVATGGGSVMRKENREELRKIGQLFYLELSSQAWRKRMKERKLPCFLQQEDFIEHYKTRRLIYQQAADVIIPADGLSIDQLLEAIISLLEHPSST